jgi:hypothetical protein
MSQNINLPAHLEQALEKAKAENKAEQKIRTFGTGATRDTDHNKLDFEGFLSPLVLRRFAVYMNAHRIQSDGTLRASDNWMKGIPPDQYMKSMWRHFFDTWEAHRRGRDTLNPQQEENLCATLFNVMGMLHEILKANQIEASRCNTCELPTKRPDAVGDCPKCSIH